MCVEQAMMERSASKPNHQRIIHGHASLVALQLAKDEVCFDHQKMVAVNRGTQDGHQSFFKTLVKMTKTLW